MWRGGLREGEGEYRFSHGDRDGSGVIEDDECDCYRCGVRACTYTHTLQSPSFLTKKEAVPHIVSVRPNRKSLFFSCKN